MLKMVVSDLDGTLLNGQNELSPKVFDMIKTLKEKGIYFAVASGRKVCELRKFFNPVKNDVIFIACDGTFVMCKNEVILKETIDKQIILNSFTRYGIEPELISDSAGDTVKIAVPKASLCERAVEYIKINRLLSCVYEDCYVKEFVKFGKNKGTALKKVLEILDININEVVAFGDNYNDIEMLKLIPKSYAMENGKAEIKRICRYKTENVCDCVMEILKTHGGLI